MRLAVWNSVVLAVVLLGFGLAIVLTIQGQIGRSIDQDLRMRADRFQFGPQAPPGQGGPFGRPQDGPGANQLPNLGNPDGPDPRRGPPQGPGQPGSGPQRPNQRFDQPGDGPRPPIDPETERMAAFRRPRFLDRSGKSVILEEPGGPIDGASFKNSLLGARVFSSITYDGERLRVYSVPWRNREEIVGVVQLARELTEQDRIWTEQMKTLILLIPLALLLAGVGGWFLTGKILKPVRDMTEAAGLIGEQDLSRRLTVEGQDELGQLAETFNSMIARLESAFSSREEAYRQLQEAFEQQRRFTADASHELRTPLTRIKVSTSAALMGEQSVEDYKQAIVTADQAADEMSKLIQDLLVLARVDAGQLRVQRQTVDFRQLAEEVVQSLPEREPPFEVEGLSRLEAFVDRDLMKRVFLNLLENAARHTPDGRRIRVVLSSDDTSAQVTLIDEGEGVSPEHLPHLTERFYRADSARNRADGGVGLGLAICRSIVEAHGGTLIMESEEGRGMLVTVRLNKDL